MVKKILVNELVEDGAELLGELDRQGFRVEAMFWVDIPEQDYWRLVIASPLVRAEGPVAAYRRLGQVLRSMNLPGLALEDISLLEPDSEQFRTLRAVAENSSGLVPGPSWVRFDDAIVYRWTGASLTAELDREVSSEQLAEIWETERKLVNAPQVLFNTDGKRVTMRFHPQHGKLGGIGNIKQQFLIALHRPDAFPGCEVRWLAS
ncbi:MAG TPA: hypothetical protein VEU62_20045 [Bryobacterales bacterium]|nr:hypothetical protein [Bryobacterales bacterium]